ncbi:hypothetical protein DMP41_12930 [Klebsiella pneumoniae]|nr:hypothetical protein DMP41_12930 [Klebsiella pneumoniae]
MAAPLRYPLILLAWGAMAAIYLPLLPAAGELVGAARSPCLFYTSDAADDLLCLDLGGGPVSKQ